MGVQSPVLLFAGAETNFPHHRGAGGAPLSGCTEGDYRSTGGVRTQAESGADDDT